MHRAKRKQRRNQNKLLCKSSTKKYRNYSKNAFDRWSLIVFGWILGHVCIVFLASEKVTVCNNKMREKQILVYANMNLIISHIRGTFRNNFFLLHALK